MKAFWKKYQEDPDAKAAVRYAEGSLCKANEDLIDAHTKAAESKMVARRLREHNVANHYDAWLCEQFVKYYAEHRGE
jgi:hypothetical protein